MKKFRAIEKFASVLTAVFTAFFAVFLGGLVLDIGAKIVLFVGSKMSLLTKVCIGGMFAIAALGFVLMFTGKLYNKIIQLVEIITGLDLLDAQDWIDTIQESKKRGGRRD